MKIRTLACVVAALPYTAIVHAQSAAPAADGSVVSMEAIKVEASADASAGGLAQPYAGGQVARGGRVGVLGTQDIMSTPFSVTSYTNELIQDKQARSVGDVLQNDAGVRVARGFGNFQESYFIRGFILSSDDVAYNGLYSLLPRQYIATELFERVEVLRGASAFLTGAAPSGGGIGGVINLVPKRAPNEPLTRFTTGVSSGGQFSVSTDIARRFGPDDSTGIRLNVANRSGDTGIDDEHSRTSLVSLGLDWRSADTRLSADIGWQENKLKRAAERHAARRDQRAGRSGCQFQLRPTLVVLERTRCVRHGARRARFQRQADRLGRLRHAPQRRGQFARQRHRDQWQHGRRQLLPFRQYP